ncbi:MAG: hypothetical protein DHS20C18_33500 [Saprospiraceae bacterium]|nr:MAG: hypothetical protein DHS20C18_33500 [Saprospiraceae bacterium]
MAAQQEKKCEKRFFDCHVWNKFYRFRIKYVGGIRTNFRFTLGYPKQPKGLASKHALKLRFLG